MATGDVQVFEEFADDLGNKLINLDTDTIKLGIVDDTLTPLASATARWATYVANEVSTAGGYVANGLTLANTGYTEAAGVGSFVADNEVIAQDGSGFTDARWAIIYSDTASNDEAIAFVDMGVGVSEQAGPITFDWNGAGVILTITVNDTFT